LRIAVRRHHDIGAGDGIAARLDPAGAVALVADRALAAETDQIDLGVPLAMAATDRAFRIEAAVARLQRDDVECVGTVRSVAMDDVAGMADRTSPSPPERAAGDGVACTRSAVVTGIGPAWWIGPAGLGRRP